MDITEVKRIAAEKLKGVCSVCKVCNGIACAGQVPGYGGAGTGSGFIGNVQALYDVKLNLRVLHEFDNPSPAIRLLGMDLSMPILCAPVAGVKINKMPGLTEKELATSLIEGAKLAGTIGMAGDGGDGEVFEATLAATKEAGGFAIPTIKPRLNEEVLKRIRMAVECGAKAVAIDVDAAGLTNMALTGQKVEPKSGDKLREIVGKAGVKVILKGIMTPEEALIAVDAGVSGIVVSNHGGRAMDFTPATATVLPGIADAVSKRMAVLVDGGVRSGIDVLKMLALGADAVLIGRPLAIAGAGGGAEAVKDQLLDYSAQLKRAMILTGTRDAAHVSRSVIYGR